MLFLASAIVWGCVIETMGVKRAGWEARVSEIINQKLADKYGIIFRIGKRNESDLKSVLGRIPMEFREDELADEEKQHYEKFQKFLDNYFSKPQALTKKLQQYVEELKALGKPLQVDPATIQKFREEVEEEAAAWYRDHAWPQAQSDQ